MDTRKLIELLRATIEADQIMRKQAEEQLTQVYETTTDHVLAAKRLTAPLLFATSKDVKMHVG